LRGDLRLNGLGQGFEACFEFCGNGTCNRHEAARGATDLAQIEEELSWPTAQCHHGRGQRKIAGLEVHGGNGLAREAVGACGPTGVQGRGQALGFNCAGG
jgi:hypothetical protein